MNEDLTHALCTPDGRTHRRLGRFAVHRNFIRDPRNHLMMHSLMAGMIVVHAEQQWDVEDAIEYVGMHQDFELIPASVIPPRYLATVHHKQGELTRGNRYLSRVRSNPPR